MILKLLLEDVHPGIHLNHGLDAQPNTPHISQLHSMCDIIDQSIIPHDNLYRRR